jgi:uncharacterized membrane protein YeiB
MNNNNNWQMKKKTILYLMLIKKKKRKKEREILYAIYLLTFGYVHTCLQWGSYIMFFSYFLFHCFFRYTKKSKKKTLFSSLLILIHCSFASMCSSCSLSLSPSIHFICYSFLLLAHSHVCAYLFTLCINASHPFRFFFFIYLSLTYMNRELNKHSFI